MEFLNSWIQGIVVAVIIATIIEMILPQGNSKRYIKVMLGLFIVFNIITPIINKVTGNNYSISNYTYKIDKYIKEASQYSLDNYTTNNNYNNNNNKSDSNIKEMYILNLKKDIKAKLQEKGYIVNTIKLDIDDSNYSIRNLRIDISKPLSNNTNNMEIKQIENIEISINNDKEEVITNDELSKEEEKKIKDYINSVYEININNIFINT